MSRPQSEHRRAGRRRSGHVAVAQAGLDPAAWGFHHFPAAKFSNLWGFPQARCHGSEDQRLNAPALSCWGEKDKDNGDQLTEMLVHRCEGG